MMYVKLQLMLPFLQAETIINKLITFFVHDLPFLPSFLPCVNNDYCAFLFFSFNLFSQLYYAFNIISN